MGKKIDSVRYKKALDFALFFIKVNTEKESVFLISIICLQ